jgi:hypothetical protein
MPMKNRPPVGDLMGREVIERLRLTEEYLAERARRASPAKIAQILQRVGKGNPPVEGDEQPPELVKKKRKAL